MELYNSISILTPLPLTPTDESVLESPVNPSQENVGLYHTAFRP